MLKFRCKNCDQKIGVPDDWRGHVVRCPRCKQGVDVPKDAQLVDKPLPPQRSSSAKPAAAPVTTPKTEPKPAPTPVAAETPAPIPVVVEEAAIAVAPRVSEPAPQPIAETPAPKIIAPPEPAPSITPALDNVELPEVRQVAAPLPEPVELKPIPVEPVARVSDPMPAPVEAARTTAKQKKPAKKSKPTPVAPVAPVRAPEISAEIPLAVVAPPTPVPVQPEVPEDRAAADPSVVAVTVARRTEPEPTPLADPETGNVVNIAEALTQSVVTPKPIVTSTSAPTTDFSSVFSSGASPETIPPMIDVEPVAPPIPVEVKVAEPVSVMTSAPIEADSIVTSVAADPFTAFAGSQPQSDAFGDAPDNDRALSDIVDVLPSEDLSPEGPSAATALLDTLSRTQPVHPPDGPQDVEAKPIITQAARPEARPKPARSPAGAIVLAMFAMLGAAGSLAMCVTHSHANYAVPAGVAGLLIAVLSTALAQGRSVIATITGIGAAVASMTAIAIGVLIGLGMLPGSAAYARQQLAKHLPTARAGDVEVRIRSASVLRPVLLTSPRKIGPTAQTATQTVLRVEVELKNLSDRNTQYKSWAVQSSSTEPVLLQDDEGNPLKPLSAAGAMPPGRAGEVVMIQPHGGTVGDVLLFEAPPAHARELDLQLPGNNVGSLQPLQLHIPAEMFARQ